MIQSMICKAVTTSVQLGYESLKVNNYTVLTDQTAGCVL